MWKKGLLSCCPLPRLQSDNRTLIWDLCVRPSVCLCIRPYIRLVSAIEPYKLFQFLSYCIHILFRSKSWTSSTVTFVTLKSRSKSLYLVSAIMIYRLLRLLSYLIHVLFTSKSWTRSIVTLTWISRSDQGHCWTCPRFWHKQHVYQIWKQSE